MRAAVSAHILDAMREAGSTGGWFVRRRSALLEGRQRSRLRRSLDIKRTKLVMQSRQWAQAPTSWPIALPHPLVYAANW